MNKNVPELPAGGKGKYHEKPELTRIQRRQIEDVIRRCCVPCGFAHYGEGKHGLYFLPEAAAELDFITGFGKKRASNAYELTYLGLGHRFEDEAGRVQTVVTRVLPIYSATRGPTHAKVVTEGSDAMLDILDRERQIQNELEKTYNTDEQGYAIDPFLEYGPSEVVFFGHTHPDLGCFFSPTDHGRNYSTPKLPMVTFVCDPIRRDMKAMVGMRGEAVSITVCRRQEPAPAAAPEPAPAAAPKMMGCLRNLSVEDLWRRVSSQANLLLRQSGVRGSYDCYHDWRGNTHMEFNIVYRAPERSRKR